MSIQLPALQKKAYLEIVFALWDEGPESAHHEYPDISVEEFTIANDYYNSLRCEGCYCGSCVGLPDLASNLDQSPEPLLPIANLAIKIGEEEFKKQ